MRRFHNDMIIRYDAKRADQCFTMKLPFPFGHEAVQLGDLSVASRTESFLRKLWGQPVDAGKGSSMFRLIGGTQRHRKGLQSRAIARSMMVNLTLPKGVLQALCLSGVEVGQKVSSQTAAHPKRIWGGHGSEAAPASVMDIRKYTLDVFVEDYNFSERRRLSDIWNNQSERPSHCLEMELMNYDALATARVGSQNYRAVLAFDSYFVHLPVQLAKIKAIDKDPQIHQSVDCITQSLKEAVR